MTTDFFEVQRRMRQRSVLLIVGFFVLLWAVVNFLLLPMHSVEVCDPAGVCESAFRLNAIGLVVTGIAAAAYLWASSLLTSRVMVSGPGIHRASGPDTAMLRNVVAEVSLAAGVPEPAVFVLEDMALNAFALSDGRRNGAVVVTRGMLACLSRRELAGVVAHEIGHIRESDSRVLLVAFYAVGLVSVLAAIAVTLAAGAGRVAMSSSKRRAGLIVAGLAMVLLFVAGALRFIALPAAWLMRAGLSRRREELADASAVQFTRDPAGLRHALEKISSGVYTPRQLSPVARALCIQRPIPARPAVLDRWMDSHPPVERRIAWLRSLEHVPPSGWTLPPAWSAT